MDKAGIDPRRQAVFWDHVAQFNACPGISGLIEGFQSVPSHTTTFDPYAFQDAWTAAYPDFSGYNCRITSFSLMGDLITAEDTSSPNAAALFLDLDSLAADGSALLDPGDDALFQALFSVVPGENTSDPVRQSQLVQEAWESRGITFDESRPVRLITLFVHNQYSEDENELLPGHVGVLLDCGKEGLVFVEKLAFQSPYRAVRLADRQALLDYLMSMYDISYDQPSARPFVMENDRLLGYANGEMPAAE